MNQLIRRAGVLAGQVKKRFVNHPILQRVHPKKAPRIKRIKRIKADYKKASPERGGGPPKAVEGF